MPTLSDLQGGAVTVVGANVASEKSWVTIIAGDPVKIDGDPKAPPSGTLHAYADVEFKGGTADALLSSAFNFTAFKKDTSGGPASWFASVALIVPPYTGITIQWRNVGASTVQSVTLRSRLTLANAIVLYMDVVPNQPANLQKIHIDVYYS
jgi:hypothetical protein